MSKILICGEKNWKNYDSILNTIKNFSPTVTIIQGGCDGVDSMTKKACKECKINCITEKTFSVLEYHPDMVISFHSDLENSKCTKKLVNKCRTIGIPVQIILK